MGKRIMVVLDDETYQELERYKKKEFIEHDSTAIRRILKEYFSKKREENLQLKRGERT